MLSPVLYLDWKEKGRGRWIGLMKDTGRQTLRRLLDHRSDILHLTLHLRPQDRAGPTQLSG
jgi:hypothetical protein